MKTILILFAVFAFANIAWADSSEEDSDELFDTFNKIKSPHVKELITRFAVADLKRNVSAEIDKRCPGASHNVSKALVSMIECADATDPSLTVCAGIKTRLATCTAPLITVVDNCLPQQSKGLPDLFVKIVVSSFKYACGLNGEQLFEFWNDCALPTEKNQKEAEACETLLKPKLEGLKDEMSAKKICSIGNDAKTCLTSYIAKSCTNEVTKNVFTGMMDAVLQPCNEV